MQNSHRSVRLARAVARGVTLVEVLIVVSILSLISAGVVVAVLPKFVEAQVKTATINSREIRNAANRWRANRGGDECPTVSQLMQDKEIDRSSKTTDPWDQPYKIKCDGDETYVSSSGPDKKDGTADDIVVPGKSE